MNIEKLNRVENTDVQYVKDSGIVAFQMIKVTHDFYGSIVSDVLDTKIMKDGRQIVIDGNGFIKGGTEI